MSTKNDLSKNDLIDMATKILQFFKSKQDLQDFWISHSRRELDKFAKDNFNISFYYFSKVALNTIGIRDKTFEESEQIRRIHREATNIAKYGVPCNWASKDPKLNGRQTLYDRYGVMHNSQLPTFKESIHNAWFSKTDEEQALIIAKILETKHGARHLTNRYCCNGNSFDSLPELAFYLYMVLVENSVIVREPTILTFKYNNRTYRYIPDFSVNGILYEIKGHHWLDISDKDSFSFAKYQCMLTNNVVVLFEEDYKKYLDWFNANEWNKFDFTKEGRDKRSATAALADKLDSNNGD